MDCAEFQERLFEWLEGQLDVGEIKRMRSHSEGCLRCRELEELATGDAGLPAIEPPDDMVASIMAQTTGGACDRALLLFSERLDMEASGGTGATSGFEAASTIASDPLLEMHLRSCADCARLAGALERLQRELPTLAEMQPDPGFVGDVLAATVGEAAIVGAAVAAAPVRHVVSRPAFEWREWFQELPLVAPVSNFFASLAQRPRLAFEGAFVGSLAFMLVIGLPSAGVAELPVRLMAEVRQERLEVQSAVVENFERAAEAGRAAWSASADRLGERWGAYVDTRADSMTMRSRVTDTIERWRQASSEIATHLWEGEFRAAFARMWRLWTAPWRSDDSGERNLDGGDGGGGGSDAGVPGSTAEYPISQRHQS